MTPFRVAVAPGRAAVRVAVAGPGGPARLVGELPGGTSPREAVRRVAGPGAADILLVHGPDPPADAAGMRPVPAAVAVAAGRTCAVLDVGRCGAVATRLDAGRIVAQGVVPIGGDRLDEAVRALLPAEATAADARQVRERLSLLPEVACRERRLTADRVAAVLAPLLDRLVAETADVLAGGGPVVLVGGVARTPLLAERLDAAGIVDPALVEVAGRPELAAVLAAPALLPPAPTVDPPAPQPPVRAPAAGLVAPPRPGRARRLARPAILAVVVGLLAGGATAAVVPPAAPVAASPAASGVLVQYGYRFAVPPGWEHTGGLPERRRSLLTRAGLPDGTDLIAVERTPLGYDSGAEPDRARTELRAVYAEALAAGSALSGFGPVRVAGRDVVGYRQRERTGAEVDWYVVLDGDAQLSVGCRHTAAGADAVRPACAVVVGSIARA